MPQWNPDLYFDPTNMGQLRFCSIHKLNHKWEVHWLVLCFMVFFVIRFGLSNVKLFARAHGFQVSYDIMSWWKFIFSRNMYELRIRLRIILHILFIGFLFVGGGELIRWICMTQKNQSFGFHESFTWLKYIAKHAQFNFRLICTPYKRLRVAS